MPPLNEQLQGLIDRLPELLSQSITAALILLLAIILSTWLGRAVASAAKRQQADATLQTILRRITRWGILILGGILAAEQVIPNVTSLLAGLGIAGFTIGFALQDVAKNLIAGILLLLQQPFDLGDLIEVSGFTGRVEAIQLRTTDLRAVDGRFVTIPNADVYASPIINYSRAPARRIDLTIPNAYGVKLDQARQVATSAFTNIDGLLQDPPPEITFRTLGDSYLQLSVQFWADMKAVGCYAAVDAGVRALESTFATENLEIAPPAAVSLVDVWGG
jgi:small-conductance mechanosensitive channel